MPKSTHNPKRSNKPYARVYTQVARGTATPSPIYLTRADFERINVALQLRWEACLENDAKREAARWKSVLNKFEF